jgi:NADH-quinone oxidoreductase subunit N
MTVNTILPEIVLTIAALVILMVDVWVKKKEILGYLALLGTAATLIVALQSLTDRGYSFSEMIVNDEYGLFFQLLFLAATFVVIFMSMHYFRENTQMLGEYYSLILFAVLGMMFMVKAADLVMVFMGIETLSLAVYVLSGCLRDDRRSGEAALKYILLGAFATAFLLFGISLIFGVTGSTNLAAIANAVATKNILGEPLLLLGMGLMLIGFGFKVSLVPFHMWTPDVYEGAPVPVTAFMAVGVKAAALAVFLRVFLMALPGLNPNWKPLLIVLSVLTMTVGNLIAISQENIKRMLAYSSIAHAGYLMIGMVAGGDSGVPSMLYYLVVYTFMNLGAFAVVMALGQKGEDNLDIKDYSGIGSRYPILGFVMTVFMLSLAGIPPLSGFMGKFYLFSSAVKEGYVGLAVVGVVNSLISAYYYLRVTVMMYMRPSEKDIAPAPMRWSLVLALVITTFLTFQIGLFPSFYLELAKNSIFFIK